MAQNGDWAMHGQLSCVILSYLMSAVNKQVDEVTKQKLANGDGSGPRLLGAEAALRVVAEQLPKIVPNMLINKRDGERHLHHTPVCYTVS